MTHALKPGWTQAARSSDPLSLFASWMRAAEQSEPNDPNAAALATSSPGGAPSLRMVLMKGIVDGGFTFYTHAESRKGLELAANPKAAMCFHWKSLRRQIRIEGTVTQLPAAASTRYFHSRSRRSQLGAAASQQSRPLESREALEQRVHVLERQYPDEVPRPDSWKGYLLLPTQIEFWADGPDRLHDRLLFLHAGVGWNSLLLFP